MLPPEYIPPPPPPPAEETIMMNGGYGHDDDRYGGKYRDCQTLRYFFTGYRSIHQISRTII